MPRLVGYSERTALDLGVTVELRRGESVSLFEHVPQLTLRDTGLLGGAGMSELQPRSGSWAIVDLAIDRSDVEVEIRAGQKKVGTFCGPWMRGHRVEVLSVLHDLEMEGRRPDDDMMKAIRDELAMSRGMLKAVIIPVRQNCTAYARLLPNAPEGWATVHFRTVVTREVQ